MTKEQAIKTLKGTLSLLHQTNINFDDITDYREASKIAIEELEKQIPKKPDEFSGEIVNCEVCPCCSSVVVYDWNYCKECGQHIDWSEVV